MTAALYLWPLPVAAAIAWRFPAAGVVALSLFGPLVLIVGVATVFGVLDAASPGSLPCDRDGIRCGPGWAAVGSLAIGMADAIALEAGLAVGFIALARRR